MPYGDLSVDYFERGVDENMKTNSAVIRDAIMRMVRSDRDSMKADVKTRGHYKNNIHSADCFLWINRHGVSDQADTLVACLDSCEKDGFYKKQFRLEQIREDLDLVRSYEFEKGTEKDANVVLARLEYNLTKAFLRYAVGQRYGFSEPKDVMNRLDVRDSDSVRVTFRQLFDIPVHIPGSQTYAAAIQCIRHDSVASYLREAQPKSSIYLSLKKILNDAAGQFSREKLLVNMDRARWHTADNPDLHDEYVIVNIPSYHLWALRDGHLCTDMRVGCGSRKTKTPLLYSKIKRMDINPQWVVPGTIKNKEMAIHAGDANYFDSHHYYARNRKTGEKLYGSDISWTVLTSSEWSVIQKGGVGNSLGRIIFRFDNNFSVFLHDTSSRGVFSREDRSVSHGCVRVEKPYELAEYMLRDKDSDMAEKIRYSMEVDLDANDCDKSKLVYSVNVEPQVPLYIVYFTLFPVPGGMVQSYPDVYGYDDVIARQLRKL